MVYKYNEYAIEYNDECYNGKIQYLEAGEKVNKTGWYYMKEEGPLYLGSRPGGCSTEYAKAKKAGIL